VAIGANPFVRASLVIRFGLTVTTSSELDSGCFRPGRCGPARALVAFSDMGGVGSIQTHVGGVGVGLAVVTCFDPVDGSVVWPGRCQRRTAWLWWCGFEREMRQKIWCFNNNLSFFFFFFEMMCQYVIGGQKTLVFYHDLTEGVLCFNLRSRLKFPIFNLNDVTLEGINGSFLNAVFACCPLSFTPFHFICFYRFFIAIFSKMATIQTPQ
jgi:hypothetical protein